MQHPDLELLCNHDVNTVLQKGVELWQAPEGIEDVDGVHAVSVNNDL